MEELNPEIMKKAHEIRFKAKVQKWSIIFLVLFFLLLMACINQEIYRGTPIIFYAIYVFCLASFDGIVVSAWGMREVRNKFYKEIFDIYPMTTEEELTTVFGVPKYMVISDFVDGSTFYIASQLCWIPDGYAVIGEALPPQQIDSKVKIEQSMEWLKGHRKIQKVAKGVAIGCCVLSVSIYFMSFRTDIKYFLWCVALTVGVSSFAILMNNENTAKPERCYLYKLILGENPFITFRELSKVCEIPQRIVRRDFKYCSKFHCNPDALVGKKYSTDLIEVSENIKNEELQAEVDALVRVLKSSEKTLIGSRKQFVAASTERLVVTLGKYKELRNEFPEGYDELLKSIKMLTIKIDGFVEEGEKQRELDFSTNITTLLESIDSSKE